MYNFKLYKNITYDIIGSAMLVHSELGWGLLETVYNEAMRFELADRDIDCASEELVTCYYKHHLLEKQYKMDLVVGDVIVELKSTRQLMPAHRAQLFNYLRLTKHPIGILINFGSTLLQGERYGYIEETNSCILLDKNMEIVPHDIEWDSDDSTTNFTK